MKKKLLFILFLFLFTGCKAKYNLEIYNDKISETVTYLYSEEELGGLTPYDYTVKKNNEFFINEDLLHNDSMKNIKINDLLGVSLTTNYNSFDDYKNYSYFIDSCYNASSFTSYDNYITLKTSKSFTCYDIIEEYGDIDISIKSNHKLKETNADSKKGYTYTWHITKDNYQDKPIVLQLYSNKKVLNYNNELIKRLVLIIFILGGTFIIGYVTYYLFNKYKRNINKI